MVHLLSVVTSWFNEYKGKTMRTMTELKEVEKIFFKEDGKQHIQGQEGGQTTTTITI